MAADVRAVYGGHVTYAANWGEDFENLAFMEALDYVGLNAYYPLSKADNPSDDELRAGVRQYLDRALTQVQGVNRPLVLTETGFRSVTTPWANPHAEPGERAGDEAAQARAYRALTEVAADSELMGMFIWKWPSYPGDARRRRNTGFTPMGKPAAGVLGDFYGEWTAGR